MHFWQHSCQKENSFDGATTVTENCSVYTVFYVIDGTTHHVTLVGEEAWHDFVHRMLTMAEEGHEVSFRYEEASSSSIVSSKETVTYTTTNHDDAYKWADNMANNGYLVTVSYDRETGVYTCIAIK